MFLVHYPIALWLQYWLFDYDLPAIVKATVVFVLTVAFQLGADARVAADPGGDQGAVTALAVLIASAAKQSQISRPAAKIMDCFVASLPCANASRLSQAMTWRERAYDALPLM